MTDRRALEGTASSRRLDGLEFCRLDVTYFNTMVGSIELDSEIFKDPHGYTVQSWGLHGVCKYLRSNQLERARELRLSGSYAEHRLPTTLTVERNAMAWLCRRPKAAQTSPIIH